MKRIVDQDHHKTTFITVREQVGMDQGHRIGRIRVVCSAYVFNLIKNQRLGNFYTHKESKKS